MSQSLRPAEVIHSTTDRVTDKSTPTHLLSPCVEVSTAGPAHRPCFKPPPCPGSAPQIAARHFSLPRSTVLHSRKLQRQLAKTRCFDFDQTSGNPPLQKTARQLQDSMSPFDFDQTFALALW